MEIASLKAREAYGVSTTNWNHVFYHHGILPACLLKPHGWLMEDVSCRTHSILRDKSFVTFELSPVPRLNFSSLVLELWLVIIVIGCSFQIWISLRRKIEIHRLN